MPRKEPLSDSTPGPTINNTPSDLMVRHLPAMVEAGSKLRLTNDRSTKLLFRLVSLYQNVFGD